MKLLLDTCAFIWFQASAPELSRDALAAILDPGNEVWLSSISAWEIGRKYARGSLMLPSPPHILIPAIREQSGIGTLPVTEGDALLAEELPPLHKDPFDRLLIAQAVVRGLTIVTSDRAIGAYAVKTLW